jgi:hypothetical protein
MERKASRDHKKHDAGRTKKEYYSIRQYAFSMDRTHTHLLFVCYQNWVNSKKTKLSVFHFSFSYKKIDKKGLHKIHLLVYISYLILVFIFHNMSKKNRTC